MEIKFDGKRALVTGAGRGIGRALSEALLDGGAETYALDKTLADLDSFKKECPSIHTVCADLTDWDATRKAVQELGPIDLLVNNAGVGHLDKFLDAKPEAFDETMTVHLKAVFNVSQVVAKGMIERGQGGSIVNVSSQASKFALPEHAVYSTSKAGLDMLTKVMALELGPHQIRVNTINPTVVMTPMAKIGWSDPDKREGMLKRIPQHKFLEVHEVIRPILYLLSDKSDMVNGANLSIDGGASIC